MSPVMPCRARAAISTVLLTLVLLQASGCTSWQTVNQPWPVTVKPNRNDPRVRVELAGGATVVGDSVRTGPDSLVVFKGSVWKYFAVADVRRVQARRVDALKTVPLILGTGLVLGILVCATSCDFSGLGGGGASDCSYFCGTSPVVLPPEAD